MGRYKIPKTEEERIEQQLQKEENKKKKDEKRNKKRRENTAQKNFKNGGVFFSGEMAEPKPSFPKRKISDSSAGKAKSHNSNRVRHSSSSHPVSASSTVDPTPHPLNVNYGMDESGQSVHEGQDLEKDCMETVAMKTFAELEKKAFISSQLESAKQKKLDDIRRKEQKKTKKRDDLDSVWREVLPDVFRAFVKSKTSPTRSVCDQCHSPTPFFHIRCIECLHLCYKCDYEIHFARPSHQRELFKLTDEMTTRSLAESKQLLPTQFLNSYGSIYSQDVPVRLLSPECEKCKQPYSVIANNTPCLLVGESGRLDLKQAVFLCQNCNSTRTAELEDYIRSDIWPANPKRLTFMVKGSLLRFWFHQKFLSPTTALDTLLESLSLLSSQAGRKSRIDPSLFSKSSKAHDYVHFLVEKEVKKIDHFSCRPCTSVSGVPSMLVCHIDGNQKLTRFFRENEIPSRAWLEGEMIVPQSEFLKLNEEINSVKPQAKTTLGAQKESLCGNSDFKAAREVSKRYKKLDETGIVTGCCGHGVMHSAVNMKEGETYRHTLCVQKKMHEKKAKFVVNDVVCKYWPFLLSLIMLLPGLKPLAETMKPFLSRLHGRAHAWHCQVLWFGHWLKGAAATIGEEMEQVFSWFSRFHNVTHRMNSSSRDDHLTLAAAHWNSRKEAKMANIITRRLLMAIYRSSFYKNKLQDLLQKHNIKENELPAVQQSIQEESRAYLDKHDKSSSHLSDLERDLEGLHFDVYNLQEMVLSVANAPKWKQKLISKQTKSFDKAISVIDEINEIVSKTSPELIVTDEHFKEGIFPWDPASAKPFKVFCRVVDCWHLRDRYTEQIGQSHTEMHQLLRSLERDIFALQDQIKEIHLSLAALLENDSNQDAVFLEGSALIKAAECSRLKCLLAEALTYSKYYTEDGQLDFDTIIDLDSDGDSDDE